MHAGTRQAQDAQARTGCSGRWNKLSCGSCAASKHSSHPLDGLPIRHLVEGTSHGARVARIARLLENSSRSRERETERRGGPRIDVTARPARPPIQSRTFHLDLRSLEVRDGRSGRVPAPEPRGWCLSLLHASAPPSLAVARPARREAGLSPPRVRAHTRPTVVARRRLQTRSRRRVREPTGKGSVVQLGRRGHGGPSASKRGSCRIDARRGRARRRARRWLRAVCASRASRPTATVFRALSHQCPLFGDERHALVRALVCNTSARIHAPFAA